MGSTRLPMRHPRLREISIMWKIVIGFIAFAALAIFILTRSGGDIDLGGEKHDVGAGAEAPHAASAASR
jgi:hypothetical protein